MVEGEVDRNQLRSELQEMVDHLRAARVFATVSDWHGLDHALAELDEARRRLALVLAGHDQGEREQAGRGSDATGA